MAKFLQDLLHKFCVQIFWEGLRYIVSLLLAAAACLMLDWKAAALLGLGSLGVFFYIKHLFDEQNKIEGKLLVGGFPFIDIDTQHNQLRVRIDIHNCSNQIIDCEIDLINTRAVVNTQTHLIGEIPPIASIPPYSKIELWFAPVSLTSLEKMSIDVKSQIKYGRQNQSKSLTATTYIKTVLLKKDMDGKIMFVLEEKKD